MKRLLGAVILLTLGTVSASSQYYMKVYPHNGQEVQFVIADLDSVTINDNNATIGKNGSHNGYEFVDLGLSVKWATCNIGASNPEDNGDYYSWGETEKKSFYNWSSYKFRLSGDSYDNVTFSKYNTNDKRGTVDNKTIIDPEDDVAHVTWGGDWRIPTEAEIDELKKRCTWTWTTVNGVNGYLVTSNVSGYTDRSIFLPAAGFRDGMSTKKNGTYGQYWSSSLYTFDTFLSRHLIFGSSDVHANDYYRYNGQSVRPVCPSDGWLSHLTVSMNHDFLFLVKGDSSILSVDVKYDEDDYPYSNFMSWRWESDNSAVVTVKDDGAIKAVSNGTAHISATSGTFSAQCTVKVVNESDNNHKYVDLGLSVNWATCNVGASKPEDYGYYYAWGEVETKDSYLWDNYSFRASGDSYNNAKYSKYNTDGSRGTVDNKITLDPEDDVAHVKWGGSWRMPTNSELEELIANCSWTWTTLNGVNGYRITSKKPGYTDNSIFLPVAGCYSDNDIDYAGIYGCYWSSSLFTVDPFSACYLIFGLSNGAQANDNTRHYGQSVRPVCTKAAQDDPNPNSGITSVSLDTTSLTLKVGGEYLLKATAKDGDKVVDAVDICWRSDKGAVATVSSNGLVKAISVGNATITASCGDLSATCIVTVTPVSNQNEVSYGNVTLYKAKADSTDVTSFNIEARLKGLSTLEEGSYAVYFYYSDTSYTPSASNNAIRVKANLKGDSIASYALNGMDMCSTYYFRVAVATFEGDIYYGPVDGYVVKDLVTKGDKIDLGIPGIKFASCNLGATLPEQSGDRYAWGETQSKTSFSLENYSYYNSNVDIWKGLGDDISGTQYDAATAIMGEGWHMPNSEVMSNLLSLSRVKNVTYNGNNGYLFIGPNGNAIFLPSGAYWTSSYSSDNEQRAKIWNSGIGESYRYSGCMIRPIFGQFEYPMEYVDLGLSVKWATCNVGALMPQDYGNYYAWGETETKSNYDYSTYKWCNGSYNTLTKYCNNSNYGNEGFTDTLTVLTLEDDVAHVKWGGTWRMPTSAELDELRNNCTWTWTTLNGVNGYLVTSNKTGYTDRSIFLPATGSCNGTGLDLVGYLGCYWSSSLYTDSPNAAWYIYFNSDYVDRYSGTRYSGGSVRPVCP